MLKNKRRDRHLSNADGQPKRLLATVSDGYAVIIIHDGRLSQ